MRFWCHYDALEKLPKIGGKQFIDCSRAVVLLTKHPAFKKRFRCKDKALGKLKSLELHEKCRGTHIVCNPKNTPKTNTPPYNIIFFDHLINGDKRLLSTIVHEVSHLVDFILENAKVKIIDTELRAYMMDHYCEEIFSMMKFTFNTKGKVKQRKKKNKKGKNK